MLIGARIALLSALALILAGCATAPAGPIPRVIDVTNGYARPAAQPTP